VSIIDTTAGPTWGHGRRTLADVLEREHDIRGWTDDTGKDAARLVVGESVYYINGLAAVRHRDGVAVLHDRGRVRVLTEHGEVLLDPSEEITLRAWWSDL
jgi:hypothetical protein